MLDVLNFVFSGFWTFVGFWILLGLAVTGAVNLVRAIMRVPVTKVTNNYGSSK